MAKPLELIEAERDSALNNLADKHLLDAPELIARKVAARNARIDLEHLYSAANLVVEGTVMALVYRVILSMFGEVGVSSFLFVDDLGLPTAAGFGATATLTVAVLAIGFGICFAQWRRTGKFGLSLWGAIVFGIAVLALSYLLAHYRLALSTGGGDLAAVAEATRKSVSQEPLGPVYNIPILLFSVLNLAAGAWVAAKAGNLVAWRDLARLRRIEAETSAEADGVREELLSMCAAAAEDADGQVASFGTAVAQGCKDAAMRVDQARQDVASTSKAMKKIATACDQDQLRMRGNVALLRAQRGKADPGLGTPAPVSIGQISFDPRLEAAKDQILMQAGRSQSAIAECMRRNSQALAEASARIASQHEAFERQFADDPRAAIYAVS